MHAPVVSDNEEEQQTLVLRGYERYLTMSDGCMKIAHIVLVRGAIPELLGRLPRAWHRTMNKHPRMRALQASNAFGKALIQPPVALEEAAAYFKVIELHESWETYIEQECERPIDRTTQFPFSLTVLVDPLMRDQHVRLVVFSDHYMSDGYSGMVVLNAILDAAEHENELASSKPEPLPLRPSLYDMYLTPATRNQLVRPEHVRATALQEYLDAVNAFHSLLPIEPNQRDFELQAPPVNPSFGCFQQGTTDHMKEVLSRCKQERVTFGGAVVASVVAAYYQTWKSLNDPKPNAEVDGVFRMGFDMDYNMRQRIPQPADEDQLGNYVITNTLASIATDGVDMANTTFWDFARRGKQEIDEVLASPDMPAPMIFLDEFVHKQAADDGIQLCVPHSIGSDTNISNIGRYPFKKEHALGDNKRIVVENLFVYNNMPHLCAGTVLYVTSVHTLNYSMVHKHEPSVAKELFQAFVWITEHMGDIGSDETMAQVAKRFARSEAMDHSINAIAPYAV